MQIAVRFAASIAFSAISFGVMLSDIVGVYCSSYRATNNYFFRHSIRSLFCLLQDSILRSPQTEIAWPDIILHCHRKTIWFAMSVGLT